MDTVTNEHGAAIEPPGYPFQHRFELWAREHGVLQADSEEALRLVLEGTTATPRGYCVDLGLVTMGADIIERSNRSQVQSFTLRWVSRRTRRLSGIRARGVTLKRGIEWPRS